MEECFEWYGHTFKNMGEVFEEALHLIDLEDRLLAMEFIDDYGTYLERLNPDMDGRQVAKQNLGYYAGYYDQATAKKIYEFYECEHPIFGTHFPTPEEAFDIGKKWGEAIKKGEPFPKENA